MNVRITLRTEASEAEDITHGSDTLTRKHPLPSRSHPAAQAPSHSAGERGEPIQYRL